MTLCRKVTLPSPTSLLYGPNSILRHLLHQVILDERYEMATGSADLLLTAQRSVNGVWVRKVGGRERERERESKKWRYILIMHASIGACMQFCRGIWLP
jgi:hypothetical protein